MNDANRALDTAFTRSNAYISTLIRAINDANRALDTAFTRSNAYISTLICAINDANRALDTAFTRSNAYISTLIRASVRPNASVRRFERTHTLDRRSNATRASDIFDVIRVTSA